MYIISWEYHCIKNPQKRICRTRKEAKAIKRFVLRYAKDLRPTNIVIAQSGKTNS